MCVFHQLVNHYSSDFLHHELAINPHWNFKAFDLLVILRLTVDVSQDPARIIIDQYPGSRLRESKYALILNHVSKHCNDDFAYLNIYMACLDSLFKLNQFFRLYNSLIVEEVWLYYLLVYPVVQQVQGKCPLLMVCSSCSQVKHAGYIYQFEVGDYSFEAVVFGLNC